MVTKQEIQKQIEHVESPISKIFTVLLEKYNEEELCNRRNFEGHITASGTIIHLQTQEVLLLHHKILDRWHIPGGHIDMEDNSVLSAVLREVEEETGLTAGQLISLNVVNGTQYCVEINSHPIPRNDKKDEDAHYHHDFRFVFGYTGNKQIKIDLNESLNYKWLSIHDEYLKELFKDFKLTYKTSQNNQAHTIQIQPTL